MRRLVRYGSLHPDGSQVAAVQALHLLQGLLAAQVRRERAGEAPNSGAANHSSGVLRGAARHVQGAYMWGPPGRGKTMIMQLFSRTLPPYVAVRHHTLPWLLRHIQERCGELQQQRGRAQGGDASGAALQ